MYFRYLRRRAITPSAVFDDAIADERQLTFCNTNLISFYVEYLLLGRTMLCRESGIFVVSGGRSLAVRYIFDAAQWFPPAVTEPGVMTLANLCLPDFSQFGERMITIRDRRVAERRGRLKAELPAAVNYPVE